ncbi:MAG: hypothetical protein AAF715_32145 [Myxococcota bacterium]
MDARLNTQEEAFAYDGAGMLVRSHRHITCALSGMPGPGYFEGAADVEVCFERNALGQVTRERQRTGEGPWFEVASRYEPGGLRAERETSLGHRVRYAYDRAGELSGVVGHREAREFGRAVLERVFRRDRLACSASRRR